jgi:hypothetical protein
MTYRMRALSNKPITFIWVVIKAALSADTAPGSWYVTPTNAMTLDRC